MNLKTLSIVLFFTMFLYSGSHKILKFNKKVNVLEKKTRLPHIINVLGMIGVIILEIIGSLLMIMYFINNKLVNKHIIRFINLVFLAFLIVVTLLYHPPTDKMIPFLSNMTTFAGLLYIYADL